MAEKGRIFKGKVKRGGIFNFKDFYNFIYDWLKQEDYEVTEDDYTVKMKGDSKQVEITWICTKDISDYFQFHIKIWWLILGMKDVEVQKGGQKVKMQQGLLEVNFTGTLVKDPEDKWDKGFRKVLRRWYDRYLIRNRIYRYELRLLEEIDDMIAQCKTFLTMEGQK